MRLLVLGGSVFLGRAVVTSALAAGHDVVCLTRGTSGDVPDGARWVRGDRDTADGLAGVREEPWDAVVDVSVAPGQVRRSARELRAGHYVFVSTGSVYADTATPGLTEDGPLLPPLDGDASGRSGYWPWRFAHPSGGDGRVLVPLATGLTVQLIDVRDLAAWVVHVVEHRVGGVFNAVGDAVPFVDALDAAREASGVSAAERTLVPRDSDWLRTHDVAPWAGPGSLPLWLDDPDWTGFPARSNAAATAAGLVVRPLADTFRAALAFHDARGEAPASGLSDERERELLALPA